MHIEEVKDTHGRVIGYRLDPFAEHGDPKARRLISVDKDYAFAGMVWKEATVNWSCVGAVDREHADKFARGLRKAAELAAELDADFLPGMSSEPKDDVWSPANDSQGASRIEDFPIINSTGPKPYARCDECGTKFHGADVGRIPCRARRDGIDYGSCILCGAELRVYYDVYGE